MLLEKKNAIVYGASGAVGSEVARTFATEGARVFLAGRTSSALEAVAAEIRASGGVADVATVDALDEDAVEAHADAVVRDAGSLDVSFNAISLPQTGIQGTPIAELPLDNFALPMTTYPKANFLTARAAARRMTDQRAGVILTITASPSRTAVPLMGGMAPAWAAIEALSRGLAAELGPHGVRVVCLNAAGMPESPQISEVYGLHADAYGISRDAFRSRVEDRTLRKRLPTIAEIAAVAAFVASDRAAAITGAVANLTGGMVVD
ncbi:SDR family NAD(P)-dependent oxidoreductase [Nocardia asiatica]|uniref:SDR family NAD(P)-dependent oxidoreductase n=1 Tax=Nocardia asiatica TaxID=209252 RepID=UPI0002E759F7|nr:SDR family oxidoreductase [Nocardia asiatica]